LLTLTADLEMVDDQATNHIILDLADLVTGVCGDGLTEEALDAKAPWQRCVA